MAKVKGVFGRRAVARASAPPPTTSPSITTATAIMGAIRLVTRLRQFVIVVGFYIVFLAAAAAAAAAARTGKRAGERARGLVFFSLTRVGAR